VATFIGHNNAVWAVIYAPDQRLLYSGDIAGTVCAREIPTRRLTRRFNVGSGVLGLAVSSDLKNLFVRTVDRGLKICDLSSGELRSQVKLDNSQP
jgi:WD40 repeat protein